MTDHRLRKKLSIALGILFFLYIFTVANKSLFSEVIYWPLLFVFLIPMLLLAWFNYQLKPQEERKYSGFWMLALIILGLIGLSFFYR